MSGVLPEESFPSKCFDLSARKGFQIIEISQRRDAKQKEHAEIPFGDNFGETVLANLWNYYDETVRDILKEDFRKGFRREFEGETLWSL